MKYNYLKKEDLTCYLHKKELKIYCCGPTIYKNPHKGNYRSLLFLDYLFKLRKLRGLVTNVVVNITDLDDKIFSLISKKKPIYNILQKKEYTLKIKKVLFNFYKNLKNFKTSYKNWNFVRVSSYLSEIRDSCQVIPHTVKKDGLYYADKSNTQGFYLWKKGHLVNKDLEGHPGWHLECAYIISKYFKEGSILHLGGIDLKDLHHSNELELLGHLSNLSEVNFFHTGLYYTNGKKMSKSLGNEQEPSKNYLYEIINYLVSDFDKPLHENKTRKEQILSFIKKVNDNLYKEDQSTQKLLNNFLRSPFSPGYLYRTNKSSFYFLLKKLNYL